MPSRILDKIDSPADLRKLSASELDQLAFELRTELVAATSIHGGHLASSLGAVEIILALHRVLDCPKDKIVYDVGHQAYAHKFLTGRKGMDATLRTKGGISGFPKIDESEYDAHDAGHASDALSTALGYALARDMDDSNATIAVVVGDASFAGGLSFEALNQIGNSQTRLIIILNDNGMSISHSVGAFSSYLGKVRLSHKYLTLRDSVEEAFSSGGRIGQSLMQFGNAAKDSVKQFIIPESSFFESFGVTYIGPVDGHDRATLEGMLRRAKRADGPVLIHAVTTKGKGYKPAEEHPDLFHGVGPFNVSDGKPLASGDVPTWTSTFANELIKCAADDDRIVAITAAMADGTGLKEFSQRFPERFIDVGIAEEHAVTLASGLALAGKLPVVAIYSTFLQRAYDQMMINVALQNQHVVFCLDRAGLVGEDGPTHHGAFDLSYLRTIPNMTILAPSDDEELRTALRTALSLSGPVAIRYPRGAARLAPASSELPAKEWDYARARLVREGNAANLLAVGSMVSVALDAAELLHDRGIEVAVFDMRWVKPLDIETLRWIAWGAPLFTLEENSISGGFGSAVLEALTDEGLPAPLHRFALPDSFIEQGRIDELLAENGLDAPSIANRIAEAIGQ
ncbi:MAG: 1-deoxy-D-xylulose-5-phosphate synthase [Coriobacteriaceae bacterium]|nr:1-deoxy-D-xylulose-5-phosphate synthase [Coriobacteriaceae bacterium]